MCARMMEVFAGFLSIPITSTEDCFSSLKISVNGTTHLSCSLVRQRASAEGGPTGSVNENKFFNNVPDSSI
ncbi:MAG: hypothetical protein R2942_06190 [Ignavibacteria bacterium]